MIQTLEIEGSRIAYSDRGNGPPVVLLHCSASSGQQWRAFCDTQGASYRIVTLDLYGHGHSDPWPGQRPLALADEAAALTALLRHLGESVHLVGHSYGGAVALRAALTEGNLIESLTLIEPVAFHLLRDGLARDRRYLQEVAAVAADMTAALACGAFARGMARFVDYWNGPGTWDSLAPDKQRALLPLLGSVVPHFAGIAAEGTRRASLAQIDRPTLVIEGAASRPVTRRICALLAQQVANCQHETIPGAGHMVPLTHADEVNRLIVAQVARTRRRPIRPTRPSIAA